MKKKILSLLFIVFFLLLASCGTLDSNESVTSPLPEVTDAPTPEPAHEETVLTGNVFLDAELQIVHTGNGSRAYIEINKIDAISTSMEEYLDFLSQRVEDSGYNWWTVCFEDGTGLVYTGSLIYAVEYGTLDSSDGTIAYGYGYLAPEDDGTYTYHSYTDDEEADGEPPPVGPVGGDGFSTLDATIGLLSGSIDGDVVYDPDANCIISIVSANGFVQVFLKTFADNPDSSVKDWETLKTTYQSLDVLTRKTISITCNLEVNTMFAVVDNEQEYKYVMMIQNGDVTYSLIDDFIDLQASE